VNTNATSYEQIVVKTSEVQANNKKKSGEYGERWTWMVS